MDNYRIGRWNIGASLFDDELKIRKARKSVVCRTCKDTLEKGRFYMGKYHKICYKHMDSFIGNNKESLKNMLKVVKKAEQSLNNRRKTIEKVELIHKI